VHHEAELAVVIGKVTKDVSVDRALDQVFGYTVANDVTARDAQRTDSQWLRAKGFDSSCPLGPFVVPGLDIDDLAVTARVNGEVRQSGRTSQLLFGVAYLISYISEVCTLLPGDLILTGTPAGVGPIEHGDVVECEVEEIGTLRNPVLRRD
jgi:2-keto-4-pentenoate hydratase/2-oxohepta-3-ene-1,7-dioic acid hydratase in catechol pathway